MIEIISAICLVGGLQKEVRIVETVTVPLERARGNSKQTWRVRDKKTGDIYKVLDEECKIVEKVEVNV